MRAPPVSLHHPWRYCSISSPSLQWSTQLPFGVLWNRKINKMTLFVHSNKHFSIKLILQKRECVQFVFLPLLSVDEWRSFQGLRLEWVCNTQRVRMVCTVSRLQVSARAWIQLSGWAAACHKIILSQYSKVWKFLPCSTGSFTKNRVKLGCSREREGERAIGKSWTFPA